MTDTNFIDQIFASNTDFIRGQLGDDLKHFTKKQAKLLKVFLDHDRDRRDREIPGNWSIEESIRDNTDSPIPWNLTQWGEAILNARLDNLPDNVQSLNFILEADSESVINGYQAQAWLRELYTPLVTTYSTEDFNLYFPIDLQALVVNLKKIDDAFQTVLDKAARITINPA